MKYTNKHNLPQPVVDAVVNDPYTKGESDLSVTGLSKPPRMRVLQKLHNDAIVIDVSDRIAATIGKALHAYLEAYATSDSLAEVRYYLDIDGITLSGQTDAFYLAGVLDDYKFLPLRKVSDRGIDPDFIPQLNCYAYLLRHGYYYDPEELKKGNRVRLEARFDVRQLRVVAFFRDWFHAGILKAKRDGFYYPPAQCYTYDLPLWDDAKTLGYIRERIAAHKAANKKLPRCTDEERWSDGPKWAVIRPGAKASKKNHDSQAMAEQHCLQLNSKLKKGQKEYVVEERRGGSKRCNPWCDVRDFCTQWLKEIKPYEG